MRHVEFLLHEGANDMASQVYGNGEVLLFLPISPGGRLQGRGHILPSPIAGHVMKGVSPIDQHGGHIIVLEELLLVIAKHHQDIRSDIR
jgi:hypothetical protein